jgi:hypothetical protein
LKNDPNYQKYLKQRKRAYKLIALSGGMLVIAVGTVLLIMMREAVDEKENEDMTLHPLSPGVWFTSYNFQMMGVLALSSNMFVIKAEDDGALVVYNPVKLYPKIMEQLNGLGEVKYVIIPNKEHLSFVKGRI